MRARGAARRRFLAPEVVQSSAMDCGPAALKSLFEGHGIHVSYGRLREACQTEVDGTSIDTLEEVANQLGLEAEQIMVPADHLLVPEASTLPAIVVVRLPDGNTHFIVVWSTLASWVQLMDPASGRKWVPASHLLRDVYQHDIAVPAAAWREWASSDQALDTLKRRLQDLGLSQETVRTVLRRALTSPGWRLLATLDAATRAAHSLLRSRGLRRGGEAGRLLEGLFQEATDEDSDPFDVIPPSYWSVRAAPRGEEGQGEDEEQLYLRGVVLVRVKGLQQEPSGEAGEPAQLSPELELARKEAPSRPGRKLLELLGADGLLAPGALVAALLGAAFALMVEALWFRGLLELGPKLGLSAQRMGVVGALFLLLLLTFLLELSIGEGLLRLGRRLESRLRIAFHEKIPRQ